MTASRAIVGARLVPVALPLRRPLETGFGAVGVRQGVLLELRDEDGRSGWGETLPLHAFGQETAALAEATLRRVAWQIAHRRLAAEAALEEIGETTRDAPGARACLDLALHDLASRSRGLPLAAWLAEREGTTPLGEVEVSALLPGGSPDDVARAATEAVARGHRTLKLKLGGDFDEDLARVRSATGARASLRLDANRAWEADVAGERLARLAGLGVELVEEPLRAPDPVALAKLRADSPVPIAADESVADEASAARLLEAGACDVLVLKPAAVGGLGSACRIASLARACAVPVVVTSFLDSSLGRRAALHLAAALGGPGRAAGLATGSLLARDPFDPPLPDAPRLAVPREPGLGPAPDLGPDA